MKQLNEKVAVVTGAGQGIGKVLALCLAKRGVTVIATGRYRVPSRADAFPPPHTDNGITGRRPAVNSSSPA